MSCPVDSEHAAVTAAFLARYSADRARGDVGDLARYQSPFPGFEALIAREYEDLDSRTRSAAQGDIGPFRIVRRLGKGGMGEVFLGEQETPVRRLVAVKVVKRGMDTDAVVRRFAAEREALARMSHPHVARVLEAGATDEGRPYFVMEHVEGGVPITRYCDDRGLDVRERLELFLGVCEGVHHAHQRSVIHRDLKPSNVLIAEVDGRPMPKIIDFGLAKVMQSDLEAVSMLTGQGDLLGTIEYMSPEQADAASFDVDTRTDVYSLGVILYELLTCTRPFPSDTLRRSGLVESVRTIREVDPPRPSARLAARDGRDAGTTLRAVRGDLDWITMHALEKQRERRYSSVAALGDDIRRYLAHEPITAGQPSALYRLRKFTRRNRALVFGAAAVFLVLVAGIAVSTVFALGQEQQRRRAERELRTARIEQARLLAATSDLDLAEDMLWREHLHGPDRQSYWALWELYGKASCLVTARAHAGMIRGIAFQTEGARIATTGTDGAVLLWRYPDLVRERVLRTPQRGQGYCVDFAPDGARLAVGFGHGKLVMYDLADDRQRVIDAEGVVTALRYHPGGRRLAFVDGAGVHVVDAESARVVASLPGQIGKGTSLAFDREGTRLAASGGDHKVRVWKDGWSAAPETVLDEGSEVWSLGFSTDGRHLLVGRRSGHVSSWDLEEQRLERRVAAGSRGSIASLWIDPGGRSLLASGRWGTERLDIDTLEIDNVIASDQGGSIAGSDDGRFLAMGRPNGQLRLWEAASARAGHAAERASGGLALAVSPGGTVVAGQCSGGTGIWELATGKLLAILRSGSPTSVAFSPAGPLLAVGSRDRTMRLYDLRSGSLRSEIEGFGGQRGLSSRRVAFGPGGRWIAFAGPHASLRMHDVATGRRLARWRPTRNEIVSVSASARGRIAATYRGNLVRLFEPGKDRPTHEMTLADPWTVVFDPPGRRFLVTSWDETASVFDATTCRRLATLPGHGGAVWDGSFHPTDDDLVITVCADGRARLFMVSEQRAVATLELSSGSVANVEFTPGGRELVALGGRLIADLEYYDRYIAGQVRWQIDRLARTLDPVARGPAVRAWATEVLSRPWPRIGPRAKRPVTDSRDKVKATVVAGWGRATLPNK